MANAKPHWMADAEEKHAAALQLAFETGTLARCRRHGECTFRGAKPLQAALALGEACYRAGSLASVYGSREEMISALEAVYREHWRSECPLCTKWMDE
ncbi:MAG: hypothetical protein IT514_00290 [Burkholderiales bacterium]|nr:hypothetical protein [Burkholderiales bacterium]